MLVVVLYCFLLCCDDCCVMIGPICLDAVLMMSALFLFRISLMMFVMLTLSHGVVCQVDHVLRAAGVFFCEHVG